MVDKLKLFVAVALLIGALIGFYQYAEYPQLYRVLALLVIAGVSVSIALTTERGRFLWSFVGEARTEVRKVVWPNRKETTQTTLLVLLMVLIVAIFLWILDMMLGAGVQMFIGGGK